MNMPDKWFPLYWTVWLIAIVLSFAVLETWAITEHGTTLSRFIYEISSAWPLFGVFLGAVFGGLAVHFYWHWSPPGSNSSGG
jgi:hypothetical protein